MAKRVVIAGSRGFGDYEAACRFIDGCLAAYGGEEFIILSGGARMRLENVTHANMASEQSNIPHSGKDTEKPQGYAEINKWPRRAISSFAFGTGRAGVPNP